MTPKTFSLVAGILFLLMAIIHLWRIAGGWELTAYGNVIPMWASWVAVVVMGFLAYYGLRFGTRRGPNPWH